MKSTRPVAVITGAARGIGKGCALELARGGFNLLINDRPDTDSVEKLHATQQECLAEGVEVICFPADVGDLSLHEEMLDAAQNQWGRLDCLLNNAGISVKKRGDLLDLEPDSFDQNIAINTRAPFFLAQAFSKRLLAQPKPEAEPAAPLDYFRQFHQRHHAGDESRRIYHCQNCRLCRCSSVCCSPL